MLVLTHHHAGSDSAQASLHPNGRRRTALWAQRLCPGVQAGWIPQVLGGPLPETWTGGGVQTSRSQSVSCQLPKITCPSPPTQPLPWAGALPVGGGTWCVHTLVAAAGVKAHLARPTLDAVLLTLIDVYKGKVGEEKGGSKDGAKGKGQRQEPEKAWWRGYVGEKRLLRISQVGGPSPLVPSQPDPMTAQPAGPSPQGMVLGPLEISVPRAGWRAWETGGLPLDPGCPLPMGNML